MKENYLKKLTAKEIHIIKDKGTEAPFSGKYNDFFQGMLGEDFMTCGDKQTFTFYKSMLERSARN